MAAPFILLIVHVFSFAQLVSAGEGSPSEVIRIDDPADDPGVIRRNLTAEVGDSTRPTFDPSFRISAWDGEVSMRVILTDSGQTSSEFTRVVLSRNGQSLTRLMTGVFSHDIYHVEKRQLSDSTAYGPDSVTRRVLEWEILFPEQPSSNSFNARIESEGLIFCYQRFITEQEGRRGTFRPDWAQDCYAVYHATARGIKRRADGSLADYRTGKVFTIERPKAWDAAGDTVWCVVRVDTLTANLTVTVPQAFLDRAVYPVTVDPTFGDNDEASGDGWDTSIYSNSAVGNRDGGYQHTASSGDILDSIAIYGKYAVTFNLAVYSATSCVPYLFVDSTVQLTGAVTPSWIKGAVVAGAPLSSGDTYTVCCGDASGAFRCSYDNATAGLSVENGGSLNSTWSESHNWDYRYAMYSDYHNSGGGTSERPARRRTIMRGGK